MTKLRRNHAQTGGGAKGGIVRVGIFATIVSGLFFVFNQFMGGGSASTESNEEDATSYVETETEISAEGLDWDREYFLPTSTTGVIVYHPFYALSYSEKHEQAEWTAHYLTRERLDLPWVERPDKFYEDPEVPSGSSDWRDYKNSGYDRGHLVPAADMAFSQDAIEATFLMSNISPQSRNFNKGIWRELEELTRSWAKKYKKLYVVTGPVLTTSTKGTIGKDKISIPQQYYKVLLDITEPELKGIAFLIPNQVSYEPLFKFAVSIDEVEQLTGIDFFPDLLDEELAAELEGNFNIDLWEFNKSKFNKRIKSWNEQ